MVKLQNTFKHFCYDNWKKMVDGDKKAAPVKKVEEEVKTRKITNSQPFQVTPQPPAPAAPRFQQNSSQFYPQNNYMMAGQPMMGYGDGRFDYSQQSHPQQGVDYNNMMMLYPNMGMNSMVMNQMMMQYPFPMMQNPMQPLQYNSMAGLPPGATVGTINLQPQPDSHHPGDKS